MICHSSNQFSTDSGWLLSKLNAAAKGVWVLVRRFNQTLGTLSL